VKAREAYESAVANGSLEAKRALARLLWIGEGGKKDKGRAKALCREACQGGDPIACRGPEFLKS
jgi:TPR repeat protein